MTDRYYDEERQSGRRRVYRHHEQEYGQEPEFYRLINKKKGAHLANSSNTRGAVRGNYMDDDTNTLIGNAEFMKMELDDIEQYCGLQSGREEPQISPEDRLMAETVAGVFTELFKWGCETYVAPGAERLWKNRVCPAIGRGATAAKNWIGDIIRPQKPKISQVMAAQRRTVAEEKDPSVQAVEQSYWNYIHNMTSEEAKKELIEIFFLQVELAYRVKHLRSARITDTDDPDKVISGQELVERLTSPDYIRCVNRILAEDPEKWQEQMYSIRGIINQEKIVNGKFVPVDAVLLKQKLL